MSQVFHQDPKAYVGAPRLKESFEGVYQLLEQVGARSVLDLGCASGDFLYHLPESMTGVGVDISPKLLSLARKRVKRPGVSFERADFLNAALRRKMKARRFDAVTMLGFLHTFLDFEAPLAAALDLGAKTVIVHSPFNDNPVDTRHFHRVRGQKDFQCGYAISSKDSVSRFLKKKGVRRFEFALFRMKTELAKDVASPVRNWHSWIDGERRLMNGIGIVMDEYFLVIHLGRK